MIFKDDLMNHIIPSMAGAGVMYSFGEHLVFSVLTGVLIFVITNALTFFAKKIFRKFLDKDDK